MIGNFDGDKLGLIEFHTTNLVHKFYMQSFKLRLRQLLKGMQKVSVEAMLGQIVIEVYINKRNAKSTNGSTVINLKFLLGCLFHVRLLFSFFVPIFNKIILISN